MATLVEAVLLARCRCGDLRAWDELFERHYAATGRFVWQIIPDFTREDVEEVLQDTFLKVIERLNQFHGESQFQTWVFRIAANTARDFRDRSRAAKRGGGVTPLPLHSDPRHNGNGEAHDDGQLAIDPPSRAPGPDDALMHNERSELLRTALDNLGEPCREIIELRYFGELSYEELARTLQLNEKTVSSRLSKCLDRLEEIAQPIFSREQPDILPSNTP
jgi:RNA polymerase sigma-70 factor (ECF subfamily)